MTVDHRVMKRRRAAALVESWQARLEVAVERPGWSDLAACRGATDVMFPTCGGDVGAAVAVCMSCPVRLSCLGAARNDELCAPEIFGVRGGLTPPERSRVYERHGQLPGRLHPLVVAVMATAS